MSDKSDAELSGESKNIEESIDTAGVPGLSVEELAARHKSISEALGAVHKNLMEKHRLLLESGITKFKQFNRMIYHILDMQSMELSLLRIIEIHLRSGTLTQEIFLEVTEGLNVLREKMKNATPQKEE